LRFKVVKPLISRIQAIIAAKTKEEGMVKQAFPQPGRKLAGRLLTGQNNLKLEKGRAIWFALLRFIFSKPCWLREGRLPD
jgi:hypothetical protein